MKVDIYNTEKKYDIIYADPPWAYHDTLGGNAKMGAMPYPTMTNEEICAMPIGNKIAKKRFYFVYVGDNAETPRSVGRDKGLGIQI